MRYRLTVALLAASLGVTGHVGAQELPFERRVALKESVERFYYAQRTGSTVPFDAAVGRVDVERRVRDGLEQGALLDRRWHTPITSEMLRREADRMRRATRMPAQFRRLFERTGGDAIAFQECVVRPVLTERLVRSFFDADPEIHAASRAWAERLRRDVVARRIDPAAPHPLRSVHDGSAADVSNRVGELVETRESFLFRVAFDDREGRRSTAIYAVRKQLWEDWWSRHRPKLRESDTRAIAAPMSLTWAGGAPLDDTWDNGSFDVVPDARRYHSAVWTGAEMIVWGGSNQGSLDTGYRYDPLLDVWSPLSKLLAPTPRHSHEAVWTGSVMIVYGGESWDFFDDTVVPATGGGRYDPATDTWSTISPIGAPVTRSEPCSGWTGQYFLYWGGFAADVMRSDGARYDPVTNTWSPMSSTSAPSPRYYATAVWTGSRWIVWGGFNSDELDTGAQYDPAQDSWTPISTAGAPNPRHDHAAVWTGQEMLVWGGYTGGADYERGYRGGRYDPSTDTWTLMAFDPQILIRHGASAAWTGTEMIFCGGQGSFNPEYAAGGRYDPSTDSWRVLPFSGAPSARYAQTGVWTGSTFILWGGVADAGFEEGPVNSGARYDPVANLWTPTGQGGQPAARNANSAVWTGAELIVWGGHGADGRDDGLPVFDSGARYDPLLDVWRPVSSVGAPAPRAAHSAVWTGRTMIVWGGLKNSGSRPDTLSTGAAYDPTSDTWSSVRPTGSPIRRAGHAAVWTGSAMLIWGGYSDDVSFPVPTWVKTGASYNPSSNTWTPIAEPAELPGLWGQFPHVWTGREMLVWGGSQSTVGGRYDPATNRWRLMSSVDAPSPRFNEGPGVWTGSELVIWGGLDPETLESLATGARYDPVADRWTTMSTAAAHRWDHSAVWTGREVVVWGGFPPYGERYDPATNSWRTMSAPTRPEPRMTPTMVYVKGNVIVWGGFRYSTFDPPTIYPVNTGGRYITSTDTDQDGVLDRDDICLAVPDPLQADFDADGRGDLCEMGPDLADADLSGGVDGTDLMLLGRAFGSQAREGRYDARVDFTRDGTIDGDDLAVLSAHWGRLAPMI